MKKMKILLMFIFILLLSGCSSWSDVQEEYGDMLKKNISCTYYTEEKDSSYDYYGIGKMTFSANYDGLYISFNGKSKNTLFDDSGSTSYINSPAGIGLLIQPSFLEAYLKKYLENNSCPNSIYINRSNNDFSVNDCEGIGSCDAYFTKQNQVKNEDGELVDCHFSKAVACAKKVTRSKPNYYLEFGYYKKSNGSIGEYFGVSTDKNFKNIIFSADDGEFMVYKNQVYFVITEEAKDEIYLGNNKFIDMSKIVIKSSATGTNIMYYVTGPNSVNYGNLNEIESDVAPNIDPDHSDEESQEQEDLEIVDVNICDPDDSNNTLLVFQVIGYIIIFIKILVPVILIVLGSIEIGKAAISSDDKALNSAIINFAKKVLIGLIIFFIPTILDLLLGLVSGVSDTAEEYENCTNCVLHPNQGSKCPLAENWGEGLGGTSDGGGAGRK